MTQKSLTLDDLEGLVLVLVCVYEWV